jgi:hypothetical protein
MTARKRWIPLSLAAAFAFCHALPSSSAPFQAGDVVVEMGFGCAILFCDNSLAVYRPDGSFKAQTTLGPSLLNQTSLGSDLVDANGSLYWTNGRILYRIAPDSSLHALTTPSSSLYQSLVATASGEIIAAADDGTIARFDSNGHLLGTQNLGTFPGNVDLSLDQCTLFYTGQPSGPGHAPNAIGRFDLCRGQPLSELGTSIPMLGASAVLRLRQDGSILVGDPNSGTYLLNGAGGTQRTYCGPWPFALALDRGGRSFWAGAGGTVQKYDISTGAVSTTITLPSGFYVLSLVVVGEPRAAASASPIPALSTFALLLLAATLVLAALARIR